MLTIDVAYEPHLDLPIGGESQTVARTTKMVGHAADEPETANVAGYHVRTGGIVQLVRCLVDGRVTRTYTTKELRRRNHLSLVPLIT